MPNPLNNTFQSNPNNLYTNGIIDFNSLFAGNASGAGEQNVPQTQVK